MKKTILEVYALAICFFTVLCLAIATGVALHDIVQITVPQFTVSNHEFDRHQSNEEFDTGIERLSESGEPTKFSEAEVTKARDQSWDRVLRGERRQGAQSLMRVLIVAIIDLLILLIHWRIAKRARDPVDV